jgi:eukaryotic-like serine/threonine-protein kinase
VATADRIIELLHEAKSRPAGAERTRFLDEACGNDSALKEQIVTLLRAGANEGDSDFLKLTGILRPTIPPSERPGDRIGRYKLLEQIGEGGCGVVYMAEQEEPVRRRVALKVIKLGMDTKQVIARFEAERQALAMMDHPNIAKVLDAGATEMGRPFFVMELVRGIKITDYCDQNHLATQERLELFIQVCQAIQHAHQKGIIHRDIKPSNILVTHHDDVAVPKVIDFGIAKATVGQLTDKTVFTAFAQFVGTPAYMSPEQAQMSGLDVDTRADIYSLGVLLYELLTGHTPFDAKELLAAGMDEMCRKIREEEPAKPSTRLSTMTGIDLRTVAKHRHAEPPKLIHLIRGDLDWLVMKCLEKDRTRRYETASVLAMDLQRHLNDEPVLACPPSRSYRFQKLVRRNKLAFAAAAAVSAALTLGICISTWALVRERAARGRAEAAQELTKAEAVKNELAAQFMRDMMLGVIPAIQGDRARMPEMLREIARRLERLKDQPVVQSDVQFILAAACMELGDPTNAASLWRSAVTARKKALGEHHPGVANALHDFAELLFANGRHSEAVEIYREVLAMRRKSFGNEHAEVARTLHQLAFSLARLGRDRYAEAEPCSREALAIRKRVLGNEHPDVAQSLNDLGLVLWGLGQNREAEALHREALSIRRRVFGAEHPDVAESLDRLGLALDAQRRFVEAEPIVRESLAMRRKLLGSDDPNTVWSLINLAGVLNNQGRTKEADALTREAQSIRAKLSAKLGSDPK